MTKFSYVINVHHAGAQANLQNGCRRLICYPKCNFSDYYADLSGPAKTRYREKVVACGFDPCVLKTSDCSDELASFPSMEYPDIVNYLVLQTSWITGEQMKACKSMEAYIFFVSGWVNTILTKSVAGTDKIVVTA